MGLYTKKGLYNQYDKKHKERQKEDYYATPTNEVINILNTLNYNFFNSTILEPCVGGGHMVDGIDDYLTRQGYVERVKTIGTDIKDRGYKNPLWELGYGEDYDFLSDSYPITDVDWIIMNPPYATIEPFVIRALEIADIGVIMLGRIQFLEGSGRYENIFIDNPPSDVYIYVDRIQCWKDGIEPTGSSAQGYAWYVWRKDIDHSAPVLHWIRRANKGKGE